MMQQNMALMGKIEQLVGGCPKGMVELANSEGIEVENAHASKE